MSLTISPYPTLPPLHRKLHNTGKPQSCQDSIFSKPHFCAISALKNTHISVSPCFAVNPSLVFDNSKYPFGKVHDFVPKVQSLLVSSFTQLGCLVSDDKTFDAVENRFCGKFKVGMWWALIDLIGSLWPCSVREGYVFSMGAVQVVPILSMHGPMNMNVRNSRLIVSAFKNSDSRLPKKEEQKMMHEGLITESLPNGMFRVRLDNEDMIIGYISGKMRKNFIRILPGDRVKVEVSRYDSTRGRIVLRLRNKSTTE